MKQSYRLLMDDPRKKLVSSRSIQSCNKAATVWSIINEQEAKARKTQKAEAKADMLEVNGKAVTDPVEIADGFNDFYANDLFNRINCTFKNTHNCTLGKRNSGTIYIFPITQQELEDVVKGLPNKKSCGFDGVTSKLLEGVFPEIFKLPVVVPMHKKDYCRLQ